MSIVDTNSPPAAYERHFIELLLYSRGEIAQSCLPPVRITENLYVLLLIRE